MVAVAQALVAAKHEVAVACDDVVAELFQDGKQCHRVGTAAESCDYGVVLVEKFVRCNVVGDVSGCRVHDANWVWRIGEVMCMVGLRGGGGRLGRACHILMGLWQNEFCHSPSVSAGIPYIMKGVVVALSIFP